MSTRELEDEYVDLNQRLLQKLNRLQYLNEVKRLSSLSEDEVEREYQQVTATWGKTDEDTLREYIDIRTRLLGQYLQMIDTLIKAKDSVPSEVETPLTNIKQLMEDLYCSNGVSTKLVGKLDEYESNVTRLDELISNTRAQVDRVAPEIREINKEHHEKEQTLREIRRQRAQQIKISDNYEADAILMRSVIKQWRQLEKESSFLQMFLTASSVNWSAKAELFEVMQACQYIAAEVQKYQLVVSEDTMGGYPAEELLALTFPEEDL